MLECKACIHRCIRTVLADILPLPSPPHLHYRRSTFSSLAARSAPRASGTAKSPRVRRFQDNPDKHTRQANQYGPQKENAVARGKQYPKTEIEKALYHLKDPLKLGDYVRNTLREGDEKKALELVRAASRDVDCTVSWNHLLDYGLSKGMVKNTFKLYNEMKKRAQIPDAYTYTILLRGLAEHAHFPQSLAKALSLYESLFAPNSPIKPSIKHTNAILKVCARAKDLDTMWAIAAKMPARGFGAADKLTFTTILNAMHQNVSWHLHPSISEPEMSRTVEKAILDGRRMWDDIVGRWRQGDIWIDQELVCSMGRLLLLGARPRDWDDVLSLIEQTMQIPRLLPRLGTPGREEARAPQLAAPDDAIFQKDSSASGEPDAGTEFDSVDISKTIVRLGGGQVAPATYARPGRNTLSLILAACLQMRAKQAGQEYWALLTDPTGLAVEPDAENYTAHMRLLRQARASKEAVALLRAALAASPPIESALLLRKCFRIAMSTCVRDKNSPHAFHHAGHILDLMQSALADPDVRTLTRYLELAASTDDGAVIAKALGRLGPHVVNVKSLLTYGSAEEATKLQADEALAAVALIKLKVGCCDRLLNRGEVRREEYGRYAMERGKLAAFLTRWNRVGGWRRGVEVGPEAGVERGRWRVTKRQERRGREREEREREREMDGEGRENGVEERAEDRAVEMG